jgi:ribosomal protein S18 acetylase RimI-like enzyme
MTITFKPVDHPDPEITEGILDIEQEAFGDGALSEYVIVPLLHHGKVYVASDEDGSLVASAYFMRDMADISLAFLLSVAVLPDLRGHDVGTALLNYAFSHLQRFGLTRVQLTVDPANFNALSAYREKLQFVVVDSAPDGSEPGEDRLVMEKLL